MLKHLKRKMRYIPKNKTFKIDLNLKNKNNKKKTPKIKQSNIQKVILYIFAGIIKKEIKVIEIKYK